MTGSRRAVDQMILGRAPGDALWSRLSEWRTALNGLGFSSTVYSGVVDRAYAGEMQPIDSYRPGPDGTLIVHHGWGAEGLEQVLAVAPRVVVAYSDVRSTEALRTVSDRRAAALGRRQLRLLARHAVGAVVCSNAERRQLLRAGFSAVQVLDAASDAEAVLGELVTAAMQPPGVVTVQVQGPFETSYSLAILNRQLALGLAGHPGLDVSIFATEGPGDYVPLERDLAALPEAADLHAKAAHRPFPDVVIRQMFPPRVNDAPGGLNLQFFAWEESRIPDEYVSAFNSHLDGIGAMSSFVAEVLRTSGVDVPIEVVGNAVHRPVASSFPEHELLAELPAFRFLHISSAFPRKGVDVLLNAYFDNFSADDGVTLILKTFPNPHNQIAAQLEALRASHPNAPDVRWIDHDMTAEEIDALYSAASCLVHPCRGEGFGLPVAEAMLARIPVIAPASTGLADFVSDDTALTVPFQMVEARTHLSVAGSMWAEPDAAAVGRQMRAIFSNPDDPAILRRVDAAERLISVQYSREAWSQRWFDFIETRRRRMRAPRIALITTWNSRCGIAEYSADLVSAAGDRWDVEVFANTNAEPVEPLRDEFVVRTWTADPLAPTDDLQRCLSESDAELIHVQYNFGFLGLSQLVQLIETESPNRPVVVTLHRTEDLESPDLTVRLGDIRDVLARADRLIVHQIADEVRMRGLGLTNVECIPIGVPTALGRPAIDVRSQLGIDLALPVIGTYGFVLPHKGTLELIRAVGQLKLQGVHVALLGLCAIHPDPASSAYAAECAAEVSRLGLDDVVRLITDFLPADVSQLLLGAVDVIVLPYQQTAESSSASLRTVLSVGRPIIATDLAIFNDARDAVMLVDPSGTAEVLADAIRRLVGDPTLMQTLSQQAVALANDSSIGRSTAAHTEMYHSVLEARAVVAAASGHSG
ncbi:unannotated protein [freshwater metagenome]|uniref:Unannotated protein n=1 Tax=freshwater metagenome TaxID=449393 RepID=A0A6J7EXY2_9ZZZZ|nr:glycosyltransferase [Actinomycetota bacterium]